MESARNDDIRPPSPAITAEEAYTTWEEELIEHHEAEGSEDFVPPPPPPPTRSSTWADAVRAIPASLAKVPWVVLTTRLQDVYKPRRRSQSPTEPQSNDGKPEPERGPDHEPEQQAPQPAVIAPEVTSEAESTQEVNPAEIPLPNETDSEYAEDADEEHAGVSVTTEMEDAPDMSNGVPIPVTLETSPEDPENSPSIQEESHEHDDLMSEYNDENGGVQLEPPESEHNPEPHILETPIPDVPVSGWIELSLREAFPDEVFPELGDEPSSDTDSAIGTNPYWRDIKNIQKWRWVTSRQALLAEYERLLLAKRGEEPPELIRIGHAQQQEEDVDDDGYVLEKLVVYRREEWAVRVKKGKQKLPRNANEWTLVTVTVDFETAYGWEGGEPESWKPHVEAQQC